MKASWQTLFATPRPVAMGPCFRREDSVDSFPPSRWHGGELRRIDATKTVPHRGGGAGGQDRQDALVLIIAIERNPRQRGQVIGAFREDHARPRGDCGLETGAARQ